MADSWLEGAGEWECGQVVARTLVDVTGPGGDTAGPRITIEVPSVARPGGDIEGSGWDVIFT